MANELTAPNSEPISKEMDAYLRAESIVQAINASLPTGIKGLPPIPKDYVFKRQDKSTVTLALHSVFELAGGASYLLAFAQEQPEKFLNLWVKTLNDEQSETTGVQINFNSPIPQNALDLVSVNEAGKVVTLDLEDDLPE